MRSDFEIMAKAREVRNLAIELELRRKTDQYVSVGSVPPEICDVVESGFDDVLPAFERFTGHSPASLDAMAESMGQIRLGLDDPVADAIGHVDSRLSGWWGSGEDSAKSAFDRGFLRKMPGILKNQVALFGELDDALATAGRIASSGREDLMAIADRTIEALNASETGVDSDLTVGLGVLAVTADGLAATVSGGADAAAGLALAGEDAGLTVTGIEKDARIGGRGPRAVVDSMCAAIRRLAAATRAKEALLAEAITADLAYVAANRAACFEPVRPGFVDDPVGGIDGFRPPSRK